MDIKKKKDGKQREPGISGKLYFLSLAYLSEA